MTRQRDAVHSITTKMKNDAFNDIPKGKGYEKKIEERIKIFAEALETVFKTEEPSQQNLSESNAS